jgi:hypothetical protein
MLLKDVLGSINCEDVKHLENHHILTLFRLSNIVTLYFFELKRRFRSMLRLS